MKHRKVNNNYSYSCVQSEKADVIEIRVRWLPEGRESSRESRGRLTGSKLQLGKSKNSYYSVVKWLATGNTNYVSL